MQILVVSDSHRNIEPLDTLARIYPNMDLYIHAGDSEEDEFSIMPFRSVQGNCDYGFDFPSHFIIPSPKGNILVQHSPIVKQSFLKENDIKIVIHGHTHVRRNEEINGILYLNPGAISYARDKYDQSYMILEITNEKIEVIFRSINK